jgi:hypothetical protein
MRLLSKTAGFALLSSFLLSAGTAHAQWSGMAAPPSPGAAQAYSPTALASPALFKRIRKDDLHGSRKIVAPFFQVEFVTGSKASSVRGAASVSQTYSLTGLSPLDMQAITDALYDRFVADLTAQGFTVIPLDQAKAASPSLTKLLSSAKSAPYTDKVADGGTASFFTPHGMPIYFHQGDPELGGMANVGSRAHWDQPAAAKELDATLIGARFAVTFVEQTTHDKAILGFRGSNARVNSNVDLSIDAVSTHMWVTAPKNQARLVGQPVEPVRFVLASPLILPDDPIVSAAESTTASQKRGDAAGLAVGMLLGGGYNAKTKAYTVTVDPVKYRAGVGDALAGVSHSFVETLKTEL